MRLCLLHILCIQLAPTCFKRHAKLWHALSTVLRSCRAPATASYTCDTHTSHMVVLLVGALKQAAFCNVRCIEADVTVGLYLYLPYHHVCGCMIKFSKLIKDKYLVAFFGKIIEFPSPVVHLNRYTPSRRMLNYQRDGFAIKPDDQLGLLSRKPIF